MTNVERFLLGGLVAMIGVMILSAQISSCETDKKRRYCLESCHPDAPIAWGHYDDSTAQALYCVCTTREGLRATKVSTER